MLHQITFFTQGYVKETSNARYYVRDTEPSPNCKILSHHASQDKPKHITHSEADRILVNVAREVLKVERCQVKIE